MWRFIANGTPGMLLAGALFLFIDDHYFLATLQVIFAVALLRTNVTARSANEVTHDKRQ